MESGGLRNRAYAAIKKKIVTCEYKPGTFLDSAKMEEELQISRTPVREAMTKLEQEGLLQIIPKKGVMITPITSKAVRDVYMIRGLLEPGIIRQMGHMIPKDALKEIASRQVSDFEGMDIDEIMSVDDALHRVVVYSTNNQYIINIFEKLCDEKKRINIMTGSISHKARQNQTEHSEMIELLLKGKYEEAAKMMELHLDKARKQSLEKLLEL